MKINEFKDHLQWCVNIIKTIHKLYLKDCSLEELSKVFPGKKSTLYKYISNWLDSNLIEKKFMDNGENITRKTPYLLRGTQKLKNELLEIKNFLKEFLQDEFER